MKPLILLFFLGHLLGDFYFQSNQTASEKDVNPKVMLKHCMLYGFIQIVLTLPFICLQLVVAATVLSLLHAFVDSMKALYLKSHNRSKSVFLLDQFAHILCLSVVSFFLSWQEVNLWNAEWTSLVMENVNINVMAVLSWITLLLLNYKPASIVISKLLAGLKPLDEEESSSNAGRWIGLLERLIMMVFIALNQYSAIGLVLTAKSIARYDKISKSQPFAEYYLLGTLLSTLIVVVSTLLIL